jgi:hypothetical protein
MGDIDEFECYEADTPEDIAYAAHHKIDVLTELLVSKGIISASDLKAKLDELAIVDEDSDEEEVD